MVGHHLPDRRRARWPSAPSSKRAPHERVRTGRSDGPRAPARFCTSTTASSVIRHAWRMHGDLVERLHQLGRAHRPARRPTGGHSAKSRSRSRRIAPVSSSTATVAPPGRARRPAAREMVATPSSNSRYSRAVQVVGRSSSDSDGGALTERHEQVRMLVVGEHDGDRPLDVGDGPRRAAASSAPVAYDDVARCRAGSGRRRPCPPSPTAGRAALARTCAPRSGRSGMSRADGSDRGRCVIRRCPGTS